MSRSLHIHVHDSRRSRDDETKHDPRNGQFTSGGGGSGKRAEISRRSNEKQGKEHRERAMAKKLGFKPAYSGKGSIGPKQGTPAELREAAERGEALASLLKRSMA